MAPIDSAKYTNSKQKAKLEANASSVKDYIYVRNLANENRPRAQKGRMIVRLVGRSSLSCVESKVKQSSIGVQKKEPHDADQKSGNM